MDYPEGLVRNDETIPSSWCAEWLPIKCDPLLNTTILTDRGTASTEIDSLSNDAINSDVLQAPQLTRWVLIRAVILSSIGGISLAANGAALASICRQRSRRVAPQGSSLYTLLAHMAAADLLVAAFCLVAEAVWTYTVAWLADDPTCKAVKYAQLFALYLSTYILLVLGLDQLLIVRYPLRKEANGILVRRAVWAAWVLAAILALPQLFIFRVVRGPFQEEFYQCVTYGSYSAPWQEQLYTVMSLLLMFVFPLAMLVATYAATFQTIANLPGIHGQHTTSLENDSALPIELRVPAPGMSSDPMGTRRRLLARAKKKSLMITVVIVAAFVICWTPYYAMMLIFIFDLDPDQRIASELQSAIFFFGSSTAMINPVIYGVFHLRRPKRDGSPRTNSNGGPFNSTVASLRLHTSYAPNCPHAIHSVTNQTEIDEQITNEQTARRESPQSKCRSEVVLYRDPDTSCTVVRVIDSARKSGRRQELAKLSHACDFD